MSLSSSKYRDVNKNILILGGSSYIGRNLFERIGCKFVLPTYCRNPIKYGVYFNPLKMELKEIVVDPEIYSHALILLGITNPDSCAKNIKQSTLLNVNCIKKIIDQLNVSGIIPVFASTEAVFNGGKGNYIETDDVHPLLTYGSQKVQVEHYLEETCKNYLIVRLSTVFGSKRGDGTLFTSWMDKIEQNIDIDCAYDHIFSPVHINEVVNGLLLLIRGGHSGIFHLCNKDSYSRLKMLELLINCYKQYSSYDGKVIKRRLHDFQVEEKRPLDISMRPNKIIQKTGLEIRSINTWCQEITKRWFA